MSSTKEQGASRAEALYFDYCARRGRGLARPEHFERLYEQHSKLTAELREWQRREQGASHLFGRIAPTGRPESSEALDATARTFRVGQRIGEFVPIRLVGKSGMGQVQEAEQSSMRHRVASRFPLPDRVEHGEVGWFARDARACSDSPVVSEHSGAEPAAHANRSNEWARVHNAGFSSCESWNDGVTPHARGGSLALNGLGFHDMQGNVWEFCSDASEDYTQEMRRDPEMPGTASSLRIIRGGSFVNLAHQARVSLRDNVTPELRSATTGVRPAHRVFP